ncbi:sugar-binding transcriptional regulator [Metabacillus hrfriensis]|uniref:Sugar-binding transcriptional regulator n=1 Tax=Metabacillus hrfriensis TaxID=3048891 RepID=A0ACD4RE06_9BACI|nr:sugar-binding transcriptional regulator [Metabacillus sp. CT-WN-B3]WHZ58738.1 sugar-binding transcriptional regulator [Metabacillus sp. CT-WN-B3]
MNKNIFTENLLIKVAWYYYKENLTQNDIAEILNISRNKVVRLLDKARAEGVVQFQIKGYGSNCLSIEKEFKETFSLQNAFVIPTPIAENDLSASLAKAAAQFIQNKLEKQDLVGFGWGKAVSNTIEHLSLEPDNELSVVTLTGGVNYYFPNSNSVSGGIGKFNKIHVIPTPFMVSTEEMAAKFLNEPSVKEFLDLAKLSKYVVVGIGGIYPDATIILEEKMTINELTHIKQQNAVGDILGQFFNRNGEVLDLPHHARLIGTKLSTLKEMNNVIAVAGGDKKVEAIYGALKGKYIHTMITDESTAESLIKMEVESKNELHSGA